MPSLRCYWEAELRQSRIADEMGRNRFSKIAQSLHFTDNNDVTDEEKEDRLWKLRPWLNSLRDSFQEVSPEENQSIDEIMVAFKGRSLIKQYMEKKPKKWGFKLWGRCSYGFCHDFNVYQGRGTGIDEELAPGCGLGGSVVMQLCQSLPKNRQFKIFADNYFSNFTMAKLVRDSGIGQYTGTIKGNRVHNAPLTSLKAMEKLKRGSGSTVYDKDRELCLVRWYDNKCVTLISTYAGTGPLEKVKRYDRSKKEHIEVDRPAVILGLTLAEVEWLSNHMGHTVDIHKEA
ncbi:piggyBac transposable element-derived protein 3-like [Lineus longissimus]|uniref:piggyBac transposable element-derived protein 3-like n=1 Tax=Lineus longissimus TaxID=88925 RepID=UPI00315D463E